MKHLTLKEFKAMFDTLGIKYEVRPHNHTTGNNYSKFDRGEPCETVIAIADPNHPYSEVRLCFLAMARSATTSTTTGGSPTKAPTISLTRPCCEPTRPTARYLALTRP